MSDRKRVLILCTGNSARSQMAEGLMKSFDPALDVHSAGTAPAPRVHPAAIEAMREIGVDISAGYPKSVSRYLGEPFDFVITVCDHANETCPIFTGPVRRRVHIGFEDPAAAVGSAEDVLAAFRKVRGEIADRLREYYLEEIAGDCEPGSGPQE
jgi:arsenate reductase